VSVRIPHTDRPTFEPRDVRLGQRSTDYVEVLEGLEEGELVVVNGAFRIDSELQIRGRPSMMAPEFETDGPAIPHTHEPVAHLDGSLSNTGAMIDHYLAFTEALAADQAPAARESASAMRRALGPISADAAAARTWESLRARLDDRLARASTAGEIAAIRAELPGITSIVQVAAEHSAEGRQRGLRIAVCPMTDDGVSGIWLTNRDEIRNPYFGAEMLTCGDLQGAL
jgi:membrane fusion protein, copper/silver efflux system